MLKFVNLALRRGPQLLFTDVNFTVHAGQKVGLTGGNGCGKSSLFAMILGELSVDDGEFRMPDELTIAHVAQETPATDSQAIDYVLDGDAELRQVQKQLQAADQDNDGHLQAELHARLGQIGGYQARARAARLMFGLGFAPADEGRPVETFSGGWRMRLNLARALMCRSDLLLLDEPTNHLDLDAVIWLEEWLRTYPGTLLLISHDRDFLDKVVNAVAHVEQNSIRLYKGNYSEFEAIRREQLARQRVTHARQQREIAHMQQYVERFRAKANKARQAQSRLKALARMALIAPAHVDSPFQFSFRQPASLPAPVLRLEKAAVGYTSSPLLENIDLILHPGDRIGLLGRNGAGKSTVMKLIAGEMEVMAGRRRPADDLAIGYFAQHQLEQLDIHASAMLHLRRLDDSTAEQAFRDYLGGFGFHGDRVFEPVGPFSGGEKARLVLALIIWQRPNLLLLDEPTNHLDLEMRHALNMALQDFAGPVVLVSHDRHLLRTVCDRLLLVDAGRVADFDDDLNAYADWLALQRKGQQTVATGTGRTAGSDRKQQKRLDAEHRKQSQPLRNRQRKLEQQLEHCSSACREIETQLAEPGLYSDEHRERLKELLARQGVLKKELSEIEEQWLQVSDELEGLLVRQQSTTQ